MSTQQGEDPFEFVDYTSVSNFERLVSFLEDVLIAWEVKDGLFGVFSDEHLETAHAALIESSAATFTRTETLSLGNNEHYTFTYHCYPFHQQIYLNPPPYYHALHRWTGERRFFLLNGSDAKYVISACAIAFQNTGCTVPVFASTGKHDMFIGYKLVTNQLNDPLNETEMRFNMSLTSSVQLSTLEGLLNRFKQRVQVYLDDYLGDVHQEKTTTSVAYTYSLKNWFDEHWKEEPKKRRNSFHDEFESWHALPFGSLNDPLRELTLTVLSSSEAIDHAFQVNNTTQEEWFLSREFAPKNQQRAFLSALLGHVIKSWMTDPSNANYSTHFDGESKERVGLMHSFLTAVQSKNTNMDSEQVTVIQSEQVENVMNVVFELDETVKQQRQTLKSPTVPCGSLLWKVMFYSLEALSSTNTSPIGFLKIIYAELLRKVRWHWKQLVPLPNIELLDKEQAIDLRYNIIHQKLVMINACIQRKLNEDVKKSDASKETSSTTSSFEVDDDDSSSDIFYDSIQENNKPEIVSRTTSLNDLSNPNMMESFVSLPYTPGTDIDPYSNNAYDDRMEIKDPDEIEGVLYTHESLKLLKTDKPMNIPITQEPGLMTEDMIQLQAERFESLGSSDNATQLRAKLQSAQLYSDMQAFKAANPQACLQDFVRWHSPRDWIDNKLSARMSESNNIWQELWKCSKRIPCCRQKPLFNVSGEAEKALVDLETTSIHEFFAIMLPTIALIAYDTLASHSIVQCIPSVSNGIARLETDLAAFRWDDFCEGKVSINKLLSSIRQQESMMCYAISLLRKLPDQYQLVNKLLLNTQDCVEQDERNAVFQLFKNEHGVIAEPSFREYLIYNDIELNKRRLPLKQYAFIKGNQVRIVDLHTTDALYA